MTPNPISQEELKRMLAYDPVTGLFSWLINRKGSALVGAVAGNQTKVGYVHIKVNNRRYAAHRLAWLYMTGEWPLSQIDHISGVKSDNRWWNLRDVSVAINNQNRHRANKNNSTSILGVYAGRSGGFSASITRDFITYDFGTFDTADAAKKIRDEAHNMSHEELEKLAEKKSKRGGSRKGAGRPAKTPGEPMKHKTISINAGDLRKLLVIGDGNLSEGVRKAAEVAYDRYLRS